MPKFCRNCGKPVGKSDRFCTECGEPIRSSSGRPKATSSNKPELSLWSLGLLSLVTLGAYQAYWGYRVWWRFKKHERATYSPAVRGFFLPFSGLALFPRVFALNHGSETGGWIVGLLYLAAYIGYAVLEGLNETQITPDTAIVSYVLLLFLTTFFLMLAQGSINRAVRSRELEGSAPSRNWPFIAIITVVFVGYLAVDFAAAFSYRAASSVPRRDWQLFTSAEGHFQIRMPAYPTTTNEPGTSDSGIAYTLYQYDSGTDPDFSVSYFRSPTQITLDLNQAVVKVANEAHGAVTVRTPTTFQGSPALQFTIRIDDFSLSDHYLHGIVFGTTYETYVLAEETGAIDPPDYGYFISSFKGT